MKFWILPTYTPNALCPQQIRLFWKKGKISWHVQWWAGPDLPQILCSFNCHEKTAARRIFWRSGSCITATLVHISGCQWEVGTTYEEAEKSFQRAKWVGMVWGKTVFILLFPCHFTLSTSAWFELWGHLLPHAVIWLVRCLFGPKTLKKSKLVRKNKCRKFMRLH